MERAFFEEHAICCTRIPFLLRKGMPLFDLATERSDVFLVTLTEYFGRPAAIIGPLNKKLVKRRLDYLYVDLRDPTCKAYAVEWLNSKGCAAYLQEGAKDIRRKIISFCEVSP